MQSFSQNVTTNKPTPNLFTGWMSDVGTQVPGEPGLADCPLNSPSFIPGLRILLGQT